MSGDSPDRLFWLDIESTGLDPGSHDILEVAAVVTSVDLAHTYDMFEAVVRPWPGWRNGLDPFVTDMHTQSGLFAAVEDGIPYPDAEEQFAEFVAQYPGALLAGSGVHFDRAFIGHEWPGALSPLHYRNLDVSTLRSFVAMYRPDLYAYEQRNTHRALEDMLDAINELRHYRKVLAQPDPSWSEVVAPPAVCAGPAPPATGHNSSTTWCPECVGETQ